MNKGIIVFFILALLSGCSPKIQERIVYETDTVFKEKKVFVTDTVYKYRTEVKTVIDSIYIRDTLEGDILHLESNYAYAKAWLEWPHLKGEIRDKDTTLSFKQDSARVRTEQKETHKKERRETITITKEVKYIPWWIYLLWGLSLGLVLFFRFKP